MSPDSSKVTTRKTIKRLGGAHQIVAALVALSVFLAQALPMAASYGAGEGDWIVICSSEGAKLIQLDGDDPNQGECSHCSYCLISDHNAQGNMIPHSGTLTSFDFTNIIYGNPQTIGLTGPEQYWSACRGPPIASKNSIMIASISLPTKEQIQGISNAWGAPCF